MVDKDPGTELPQRVRGAARTGRSASASPAPMLSEELRQRIRAAVTAERSLAATKQDEAPGGEASSPEPVRPLLGKAPAPFTPPARSGAPVRNANAGPIPEDEITEWLGTTAKPPAVVTPRVGPPRVGPSAVNQSPADSPRPAGRSRARRAARFAAIVVVIGVLAVTAVRLLDRSAAGGPPSAAATRQAAEARAAAASWVAQQVSRDVTVSCDPVMCAALRDRGFPSSELLVLGSASRVPVTSAVVVETPAVLSLFGSSLATAWTPAVLASFGSGPSLVTVRVIAPHGVTAYHAELSTDLAERKTAGAALLNDPQISVPSLGSGQLSAGAVDSRLLEALVFVAGHQPISIVQFGNPGPGASAGIPLRYVDLAERDRAGHLSPAAYVRSVRAFLSTADLRFRPASMATVVLADGEAVLRIEVTAPSPLGVFGTQPVP
jgi:hypothetical protein